jgi:hypothetical protein
VSIAASPRTASRRAIWSQVDAGFFVANRGGEFVGYIDTRSDGTFVAVDGTSALLGEFPRLTDAQTSVATAPVPTVSDADARSERTGVIAATLAGLVAIGILVGGAASGLLF